MYIAREYSPGSIRVPRDRAGAAQLPCLPAILHPSSLALTPSYREREDGRRRIVLPILPSSMTLGDDHREGANVLLPPALSRSPFSLSAWVSSRFGAPCAPSLPPSSASSFSFSSRCCPLLLSSSPPAGTLRSSYHNRRHPSCITCHFVPQRILSPRHDNRARIQWRIDSPRR